VRKLLARYDWVFWLDADALIMNPNVPLESLLDTRYSFILVKQPGPTRSGSCTSTPAASSSRSDDWSRVSRRAARQSEFIEHPCWGRKPSCTSIRIARTCAAGQGRGGRAAFNSIANSYVKGDFVFHAINPMRTESGKIQLIERVRDDDARIPDSVEPGIGVGLMYYDEEEQDLLEFTVPSLLSSNSGIPPDSLHLVRTFERSFGERYGWEHISRFRLERIVELLATSRHDVVMLARPGTQFFGGWRRKLLVELGSHDLGIARDAGGRPVADVVVMRNNEATRGLLGRCRQAFEAVPAGDRNAVPELVDRLLAEELRREGAEPVVSWIGLGPDVVRIGPAREVSL
jgi:hypothetical protein